jgi:hypothetical protein
MPTATARFTSTTGKGEEAVDLRLLRRQAGEDPSEPQCFLTKRGTHPASTAGRRVPLVEDQVDDLEHRRQPNRALGLVGRLEPDLLARQRALRPHDALRDGCFGGEERPGDLGGCEPAEEAQRERDTRLGGQHRVVVRHPAAGHCSSAATSASWASSSARPTSRTMRAIAAMSRADSMRQTASTRRWGSVAVTATDQPSHARGGPTDAVRPSACASVPRARAAPV